MPPAEPRPVCFASRFDEAGMVVTPCYGRLRHNHLWTENAARVTCPLCLFAVTRPAEPGAISATPPRPLAPPERRTAYDMLDDLV